MNWQRGGSRLLPLLAALGLVGCAEQGATLNLLDEFDYAEERRSTGLIDLGVAESRSYLGAGWSGQDERWTGTTSFVWGTGRRSVVRFDAIDDVPRAVRFRVRPPGFPDGAVQRIQVRLNGEVAGEVELAAGFESYRVALPREAARDGENLLELAYAEAMPPTMNDARERAAAWDWIRLVHRDAEDEEDVATMPGADVDETGLFLPLGARLDYYLQLDGPATLSLSGAGTGNHPQAILRVDTIGEDGVESSTAVNATTLGEGWTHPLALTGPARLSFRLVSDPGGRGIRLRAATVDGATMPTPGSAGRTSTAAFDRPNVIVYLVDTLRADHLEPYGYGLPTSPALAAMAADGVVFDRMYAQSGWTRPSVASVMTGLNPVTHGVLGREDGIPDEALTLPLLLSDLGYATTAVVTNGNASDVFGFDLGFDSFLYLNEEPEAENPEVHRLSDDVNDEFLAWLDDRNDEAPFFAYLHTTDPHAPYAPREPYRSQFVPDGARTGLVWPRFARAWVAQQEAMSPTDVRDELVALYDAEIAFNDAQFGALLAALEERGIADNTVVIFTSDHGEEFLDHDDYGHGMTLYRELIQVPLVMRLPGNYGAGARPVASAQHIDLLPTILELAGGDVPDWAQGRSLLPAVDDPAWDSQELVRSYLRLDVVSAASLVLGDWHLLRVPMESEFARTRGLEMYDVANDPAQLADVRPSHPALAGWLLRRWRAAEAADTPLFAVGEVEIDEELAARLRDLGYIR